MVYWITGLSGSGKTTIGRELFYELKKKNSNIVFLDGDALREVFGNDLGYTIEDRRKCARRYSLLCKMLSEQGLIVICCTVSMFDEVREWNRRNIKQYFEIYIKVPLSILEKRDQKGIYSGLKQGRVSHVIGLDLNAEEPKFADLTICNNGDISARECAEMILDKGASDKNEV
jgi:cytidine diphosphoramidate kinase